MKNNVPYAEFGERLSILRRNEHMTRQELAHASKVAASTIVNYERGTRIPLADTAVRMAHLFGVSVDELLVMERPDIAMANAQAMDQMRSISGKKGADRLRAMYEETTAQLAGGELEDTLLMELGAELNKMALLAQQCLCERYIKHRDEANAAARAEATADAVKVLNEALETLKGKEHS